MSRVTKIRWEPLFVVAILIALLAPFAVAAILVASLGPDPMPIPN